MSANRGTDVVHPRAHYLVMLPYLTVLIFVALVVYGLERNRRLQSAFTSRLSGSCDVRDRDVERTRAELLARSIRPEGTG